MPGICDACGALLYASSGTTTAGMEFPEEPVGAGLPYRFQPAGVLGEGSYGTVVRCWDQVLQRDVAVKVPRRRNISKSLFLREARAASRLQHSNVIRIFDVGEQDGQPYIVSELVDGRSLAAWRDQARPDLAACLTMCSRIARATGYAHAMGVIHRDLKPGNILVDSEGQPRILDFGLSRSRTSDDPSVMVRGQPIGTPAYMAPEQVTGDPDAIGAATDIYAIGVILFRLVCGQLPYTGSVRELFSEITSHADVPRLGSRMRSVPPPVEAICARAMAKIPGDRYATADDLARDLEHFLAGKPVAAYPRLYGRRLNRLGTRYGLPAAGLIALLFALVAMRLWFSELALRNPVIAVLVESEPSGAELRWERFDPATGFLEAESPVESRAGRTVRLRPGFYRVEAIANGERVEVYRKVPESLSASGFESMEFRSATIQLPHRSSHAPGQGNRVELPRILVIPFADATAGMVPMTGGRGSPVSGPSVLPQLAGWQGEIGPFHVDQREVTWRELRSVWPEIEVEDADLELAASGIPWDVAVAWAEARGRFLPNWQQLYWAESHAGMADSPDGESSPVPAGSADLASPATMSDKPLLQTGIAGLITSPAEWTCQPFVFLKAEDPLAFLAGTNRRLVPLGADFIEPVPAARFPGFAMMVRTPPAGAVPAPSLPELVSSLPTLNTDPSNPGFRTVRKSGTEPLLTGASQ